MRHPPEPAVSDTPLPLPTLSRPMLEISAATRSERGRRDHNEDDLCTGIAGRRWYAVLADGAGGHANGAEASRRVVDHLDGALQAQDAYDAQGLTDAIRGAHAHLQASQPEAEGRARMHATVVALWLDPGAGQALWSHVGDSRLYRLRQGRIDHVSRDDSVVQRMVDAGLLRPDQARSHPHKNQLVSALGIEEGVDPHTTEPPADLRDGDAFLLCSDGWWEPLEDEEIAHTLAHAGTPGEWLDLMQRLIEQRDRPRQYNFSAVAVWIGDPAETTRLLPA